MKLGLALSGGGIRGIAHAGVLKALEDNNIKVDIIGGCSSGSLIASLYAIGYSPYYIYTLFKKYSSQIVQINATPFLTGISGFMRNKNVKLKGLKTGQSIEKIYNELSAKKGIKVLSDIKMPLVITTVDLLTSQEYILTNKIPQETESQQYITDISVGKAVRSSSSFPAIFCPCEFDKHLFMDGGVLDNVPVCEVKKQGADKVIAVNFVSDPLDSKSNVMDIIMKTIDIMGNKISEDCLSQSDYIITVPTDKTGLLDVQKLDMCYKFGYKAVMSNIEEIKRVIAPLRINFDAIFLVMPI